MPRRRWWVATAVLGLTCLAGPLNAGVKAFEIPESEFFTRVRKVVLAPCKFPGYFDGSDTLQARADSLKWQVDSLLVSGLEAAGFEVVSGRDAWAAFNAVVDSIGGLFDPNTGLADSVRSREAETLTRSRLRAEHQPDAWAFPKVVTTTASFTNAVANWHGVSEKISSESFGKGLLKGLTLRRPDSDRSGEVGVLSLSMVIEDDPGKLLYWWVGGLQSRARLESGKFIDLRPDAYFVDRERTVDAVDALLKPLDKAAQKRRKAKS